MTPAIGKQLSLQIFSFAIWVETQPIEEGKSISRDRDGYFAPNSTLQRHLPLTIGRMWSCTRLTIRSGILLLSE